MNNCWYDIKLDMSNAINETYVFPLSTLLNVQVKFVQTNVIFNKLWIEYASDTLKVSIKPALVFYRPANYIEDVAHIDMDGSKFGLNWVIGGLGSQMSWFENKTDPMIVRYTEGTKLPYKSKKIIDLEEIDRHVILPNNLTLVRVDIPHCIMMGSESRWCVSIRPNFKDTTWEGCTNYIRELGLLN